MPPKPETTFRENKVIPFLKTLKNTKWTPIQQMSFVGDPDFILCVSGHYVDLELKAEGETPRKLQEYKLKETQRCGGVAITASPDNWEDVKTILTLIDNQGETV